MLRTALPLSHLSDGISSRAGLLGKQKIQTACSTTIHIPSQAKNVAKAKPYVTFVSLAY
jgi:hypothetical protein